MISRGLAVPDRLPPAYSLVLAVFVVILDYAVGPHVEFPGLFIIPVVYGAWYGGLRWGLPLCFLPLVHVATIAWGLPSATFEAALSAGVRIPTLVAVAWWIASVAESQRALTKEVELLEGLLPICSYCKKIRDDEGDWQVLEKYIQDRTAARFTHGICETCLEKELK
jgi:hypothetical protein